LASTYYLGSVESPTADFLLVWLKSSCSDPRRCTASQTCSSGRSAFMGSVSHILYRLVVPARHAKIHAGSKFLAAAQIFTISCENSKIPSRLLSVLSLHRKSDMITVAVQIQLSYSQTPKWRPSSTFGKATKICP
jgi:hypothetical protein